jgi:hypothetical protein
MLLAASVLLPPDAAANCGINKFFRSGGSDSTENVRISPGYPGQAPGNEIGRWWDSSDTALSSNFGPNDGTCPSGGWWSALMNGNLQIDGILDGPGCVGYAGCPGQEMTVVVEDYGPPGPPGVDDTAFYVGFRVDDTPANLRRYDYGRTDNGEPGNSTFPFLEFPFLNVTGSSSDAGSVTINYTLADQAAHVHTATGAGDMPLSTDSVVAEWHVLIYEGTEDPGRDRNAGWALEQRIAYVPGGGSGTLSVPWLNPPNATWLAVGIGFDGGASGIVDSALVGRAVVIEPNILADPDLPLSDRFEPSDPRTQGPPSRPRSAGGRR